MSESLGHKTNRESRNNNIPNITHFWLDDYRVLYANGKYYDLFPNSSMTIVEKMNTMMRLSLLVGMSLIVFTGDFRYVVIPTLVAIGTIYYCKYYDTGSDVVIDAFSAKAKKKEEKEEKEEISNMSGTDHSNLNIVQIDCPSPSLNNEEQEEQGEQRTEPTPDNPFMNINLLTDPRDKPPALLNVNNEELDAKITKMFNKNLYQDTGDIFNKENSQRQFITNPSTTIANDQTAFAKFAYQAPPTCKEDTIKCAPLWQ